MYQAAATVLLNSHVRYPQEAKGNLFLAPSQDSIWYRTLSNAEDSKCQLMWQKDFASLAQPWLKYALAHWDSMTLKHKDDHLDQALLYKDDAMEVLLHRFDDAGIQSYAHNHKASFVSLCLSGTYAESKWAVCHDQNGSYIEYCRCGLHTVTISMISDCLCITAYMPIVCIISRTSVFGHYANIAWGVQHMH